MLPSFSGDMMPEPIKSVVQMTDYLERLHILLVFRDCAEPREDKMFRGGAIIELDEGRMEYDTKHEGESDVVINGKKVGVVSWAYTITNMGYDPKAGEAAGRVPDGVKMGDKDGDKGVVSTGGPGKLGKDKTAAFEEDDD